MGWQQGVTEILRVSMIPTEPEEAKREREGGLSLQRGVKVREMEKVSVMGPRLFWTMIGVGVVETAVHTAFMGLGGDFGDYLAQLLGALIAVSAIPALFAWVIKMSAGQREKGAFRSPFAVCFVVVGFLTMSSSISRYRAAENVKFVRTDKSPDASEQIETLYRNTRYKFRIKFPEGWTIRPGDGPNILRKAIQESYPIGMISVGVREADAQYAGTATMEDAGPPEKYVAEVVNITQEKWPGVRLIDYGRTSLSNCPAYWFKLSGSYDTLDKTTWVILVEYRLFYGKTLYFITTSAPSMDEFSSLEQEFRKSVGSFVIEDF